MLQPRTADGGASPTACRWSWLIIALPQDGLLAGLACADSRRAGEWWMGTCQENKMCNSVSAICVFKRGIDIHVSAQISVGYPWRDVWKHRNLGGEKWGEEGMLPGVEGH